MVEELLQKKEVYQLQEGISEEDGMRYLRFIEKNFKSLCRRMNVKSDFSNIRIVKDKDDMYSLKAD